MRLRSRNVLYGAQEDVLQTQDVTIFIRHNQRAGAGRRSPIQGRRQRRCILWTVPRFQGCNQTDPSQFKPHQRGKGTSLNVSMFRNADVLMSARQRFCHEVVLWKQFRHSNLLPLLGATKSLHTLMMVSEWMEHGTIMDFVTAFPGTNRLKLVRGPSNPK